MKTRKLSLIFLSIFAFTSLVLMQGYLEWSSQAPLPKEAPNLSSFSGAPEAASPPSASLGAGEAERNQAPQPQDDGRFEERSKPLEGSTIDTGELTPEQQEQVIQKALDRLATGVFFHNVPRSMQANKTEIIEAGITREMTQQFRKGLQGRGDVVLRDNISYDPLGIEIQLRASEDDFDIREISVGKKPPIINDQSTIWKWEVTPRKQGTYYIVLKAIVQLQISELGRDYIREIVIHKEPVNVQVNVSYSVKQFLFKHWWKALIGTIAILSGLFAWKMVLKPGKKKINSSPSN